MSISDGSKKEQVIRLREKGLSYNQIATRLNVAKSTLSVWLSKLPLSEATRSINLQRAHKNASKQMTAFNKQRALLYRQKVKEEINQYAGEVPRLNKGDLFWLGCGLFLAEGGKKDKWAVKFANSDPVIIRLIMKFFRKVCGVQENKFRLLIYLHTNCNEKESLNYWSKVANIPKEQFWSSQKIITKSSNGVRPVNRLPYGTLRVAIPDVKLVRRLQGWIKGFAKIA